MASPQKKELFNYFLYLAFSPQFLIKNLNYCHKKIIQIIKRKLTVPKHYYPKEIKLTAEGSLNIKTQIRWSPPAKRDPDLNIDSLLLTGLKIKLASIILRGKEAEEPWHIEFEDREDLAALHRWNWLLTSIVKEKVSQDIIIWNQELIEEWIDRFLNQKSFWNSYSAGERICNGLLFYWLINKIPAQKVITAFQEFTKYLIKHLEYHGQNTNNHIINNARALYFAGCFLDIKEWSELGRLIFRRELSKLITSDGFLRESSSHYHFLFTRWILEVLWLAQEKENNGFVAFLKPFANKLVKQCWFFLVWNQGEKEWSIPLIGDISPDFSPDWLLSVPWSKIALSVFRPSNLPKGLVVGWGNLLDSADRGDKELNFTDKSDEFTKSGWYRFDYNDLTLFIRVKTDEALDYSTHGHNDLGSFCLYLKGAPVMIDPGRLNYTMDNFSQYGISAQAHNSILVNSFEPTPFFKRGFAVKKYMINNPEVLINKSDNDIIIRLRFYGFERLVNKRVTITRQFHLLKNRFMIEDFLEGKGFRNIEANFHFAPNIKIEQNKNAHDLIGPFDKARFIVDQGLQGKIIEDWYFPEYGKKQKSKTLVVNKNINLPSKIDCQLSWN